MTNQLALLRSEMSGLGVRTVEKVIPKRAGSFPPDIPSWHERNVLGFPSFVCYLSRDWDDAVKNPRTAQLANARVYNGRMGANGRMTDVQSPSPYTGTSIAAWIADIVARSPSAQPPQQIQHPNPYAQNCSRIQYVGPPRHY